MELRFKVVVKCVRVDVWLFFSEDVSFSVFDLVSLKLKRRGSSYIELCGVVDNCGWIRSSVRKIIIVCYTYTKAYFCS